MRVLKVYREVQRAGFSYGTLQGYPEIGTNEFSFLVGVDGLTAVVRTTANPGLALTRLLAPVFTKAYVNFCNRQALQRMTNKFLKANQ